MEYSPLLSLPRELRDVVYYHYMKSKDGYVTDFPTKNVTNADGSRIDLALRLTCRQIATETRGLALQTNTITFQNTFCKSAGLFKDTYATLFIRKYYLLRRIASRLLPAETAHSLGERYPQFIPFLGDFLSGGDMLYHVFPRLAADHADVHGFGEAPSLFRDFVDAFLLEVSQHPDYASTAQEETVFKIETADDALQLATTVVQTWKIYSDSDLERMEQVARKGMPRRRLRREGHHLRQTYSATACAIRFLESLSPTDRKDLRRVILVENSHIRAATQGAAHARGLIPFCRENPDLKIVRRANLWHTVLREVSAMRVLAPDRLSPEGRELRTAELSKGIGVWLAEYGILDALGMRDGAYSFIIDVDNEEPDQAAYVFDIVQRDAARQVELDAQYGHGISSWFNRRKAVEYSFECLPEMVRQIAEGRGGIKCDFDWPSWRTAAIEE